MSAADAPPIEGTRPDARAGSHPDAGADARSGTGSRAGTDLARLGAPVAVAIVVIANGWGGLMPGVGFWDTGEFQTVLPIMGTAHPTGYPTYVLLGWLGNLLLMPIGEPAFRVTALSLIAVGVAAAATVALVRRLTESLIVGVAAGLGLATTQVVWDNATRADPHAIHLAFVALLLLALVRWADAGRDGLDGRARDRRLILAAVVFGLAAGNHSLTLLLAPPIALYVLAVEPSILRRPLFIAACLAIAAGTMVLVFLELPLRGGLIPALRAPLVYGEPATWDGFWYVALAEQFRGALGDVFRDLPDRLLGSGGLLDKATAQFGLLTLAIIPAFIVTVRRAPRYALLTASALVITVLFNLAYANADIDRYYLGPVLWVWTWLAIFGAEVAILLGTLVGGLGRAPATPEPSSPSTSTLARRTEVAAAAIVAIVLLAPSITEYDARRDHADRSNDRGAATWLDEVLPVLEPNAAVISWWSTSTPLWYAQKVEGRRPDIFIADDRTMLDLGLGRAPDAIRLFLAEGRPTYAIRIDGRDLGELKGQFAMTLVASGGSFGVWKVLGEGVTPE
ncbi:MAG TPA: DUF2723 domain-containing protein [Candidatus Binatia bacterium]|nr:DUF2723 domain-containing protein [Candidatus Binatia bacterium]